MTGVSSPFLDEMSRLTVLFDTASSPSSSKVLKDSNYENFHADHVCNRSVGSRDSSFSPGSNMKTENERTKGL